MRIFSKKAISYFIVVSFLLLIFQSPIFRAGSLPGGLRNLVNVYDEIFAVIMGIVLIMRLVRKQVPARILLIFSFLIAFLVMGALGTLLCNLQPARAAAEDIISVSKFLIVFLGFYCIANERMYTDIVRMLQKACKAMTWVFFVLSAFDILFPGRLFPLIMFRYGLHSLKLFYYHPAVLAQVMVLFVAVFSFKDQCPGLVSIRVYRIICLGIICFTLRGKSIGFVMFYIIFANMEKLIRGKYRLLLLSLAAAGVFLASAGNFSTYYGDAESARSVLTQDSITLANEHFPVGLGFGTFGSSAASKYYSPVYVKLGYQNKYGMGYMTRSYLTDTFWPILLGEFGYVGTLFYVAMILLITLQVIRVRVKNKGAMIAGISAMSYLLICSMAATAFFNPIAVLYAVVIALSLRQGEEKKRGAGKDEAGEVETGESEAGENEPGGERVRPGVF